MSISSVSRVYDAPDPIMETDLELLGKVNTFQQAKFDAGAASMQNEINNWAMMARVSKAQDREYINTKLNNVVNKINGLGGVDLSDPNNVNSLKTLGYNIYGDERIINAVSTDHKMKAFMADGSAKLNGKNAKDYDSTYYEYQQNKWNAWLNDGQVGSSFNGPTQLNAGSFEGYQKRMQDELSKMTPDLDSLPQGEANGLNYMQVGNKFIKKERYMMAIEAMTTAQDREIMNAHAWKNMGGLDDKTLLNLTNSGYDYQVKELQKQKSSIKHAYELSTDFEQKKRYEEQMGVLDGAISNVNTNKSSLNTEASKGLNDAMRDGIRGNLYFNAFKEGYAGAKAFQQNTQELKSNEATMFQLKESRQAFEFNELLTQRRTEFAATQQMKMFELAGTNPEALRALGLQGPASNAPLSIVDVQGDAGASIMNDKAVTHANANYANASSNFYGQAYNKLSTMPGYQEYLVKNADGQYVPKDEASKLILDKAVQSKVTQFDNIATQPIDQRVKYEENLTPDDKELMAAYTQVKEASLYKEQIAQVEDKAFEQGGFTSPRKMIISLPLADGRTVKVSVSELKAMEQMAKDNPNSEQARTFNEWKKLSKDSGYRSEGGFMNDMKEVFQTDLNINRALGKTSYLDNALDYVEAYYEKADWDKVSKTINPYGRAVALPRDKSGKVNNVYTSALATTIRAQAPKDVAAQVKEDDIDLSRVYVKYDSENKESKARYMAEVMYRKGDKDQGDKVVTVDLTNEVLQGNNFISNLFPKDNSEIIFGFMLSKDGKTPFTASDNYSSALQTSSYAPYATKYQIVSTKNSKNGLESFRINMLIPYTKADGSTGYNTMSVKNTYDNYSTDFPPNFKAASDYMNQKFSSAEKAKEFYTIHGVK